MRIHHACVFRRSFFLVLFVVLSTAPPAFAASPYFKDVCASGCTYSDVQTAIDSITDSGPDKVYTIFLDSGSLESNTSISTGGKSYINFVGRGIGVSILRASLTWFQTTTVGDFFDLSGSTNITLRGITIDARTKDPGGLSSIFNGVRVDNADKIVIDSSEIQGVNYTLWENAGVLTNLIQVFNSKIRGVAFGIVMRKQSWHIFSCDIRAVNNGTASAIASAHALVAGDNDSTLINATVWGSHIHAETSQPGQNFTVAAVKNFMGAGSKLFVVGSTLHVKISTTDVVATRLMFSYLAQNSNTGTKTAYLVGSDLLYESPDGLAQGKIGGVGWVVARDLQINLVGVNFTSLGSGGTSRADIVASIGFPPLILNTGSKISSVAGSIPVGVATSFGTINQKTGTSTFANSNTVSVAFPSTEQMPDTTYKVSVSSNAAETIYVINKSTTGFTLKSTNANSTASVDWIVAR